MVAALPENTLSGPWEDYGIKAIIGESFADIFFSNSFKNGLLLIQLESSALDQLFDQTTRAEGYRLEINLDDQLITTPAGETIKFNVDTTLKDRLLKGLDDIGITLQYADEIRAYEKAQSQKTPWVFPEL